MVNSVMHCNENQAGSNVRSKIKWFYLITVLRPIFIIRTKLDSCFKNNIQINQIFFNKHLYVQNMHSFIAVNLKNTLIVSR